MPHYSSVRENSAVSNFVLYKQFQIVVSWCVRGSSACAVRGRFVRSAPFHRLRWADFGEIALRKGLVPLCYLNEADFISLVGKGGALD